MHWNEKYIFTQFCWGVQIRYLFEIQKVFIWNCSTFTYNLQVLLNISNLMFSLTLVTEYKAIQTLDT